MAPGVQAEPGRPLTIRIENFEGPLDLLLFLIRREEVSIYDIPIARITEQYLAYIAGLAQVDIDRAADFLVMAATLLDIKARMLLPKPPPPAGPAEGPEAAEEEDPRAELVRQLEAYQRFRAAADLLREREEQEARLFPRGWVPAAPPGPPPLAGVTLADLVRAFREVLEAAASWREVPREEIPLRERIREILARLDRSPAGVRFQDLFTRGGTRLEMIVTFLAVLELIRLRQVVARQDRPFGEIWIRRALPPEAGDGAGREGE